MPHPHPFVDIHCHLIPDIDDGAKDWDDALAMARMAVDDGIGVIVCTPHQLGSFGHNRGDEIRRRTTLLQQQLEAHQIPLQVLPGGDVRIEAEMISLLRSGDVMTLGDHGRHVLLELPHEMYFPIDDVLARLERLGMQGILSHPERNQGLLREWAVIADLVSQGCLMQVTAGSLHGTFGPKCQKMAIWMLEQGLVHFVATDAHSPKSRRPLIRRAYDVVRQVAGQVTADQVCREFPAAVAAGRPVVPQPRSPNERTPCPGGRGDGRDRWRRAKSGGSSAALTVTSQHLAVPMPQVFDRRQFFQAALWAVAPASTATYAQVRKAGSGNAPRRPSRSWPDERRTGNLICHSTFPLDRLGPALADLENLQQDLVAHLGVPRAEEPAHAFLFHNRDFYQRYIRQHFPDVGMRQALFIKNGHAPGMIFVYYHRKVAVDLRHESTHALLHGVLPMVPLWLDEGLAEYFECSRADRVDRNSHLRGVRWEARLGRVPDLRDLEALRKMEDMRAADYRDAWAWTHFMLHGPAAAREELRQFLGDIAAHSPPGLLSQRLQIRVPRLQDAYLAHFRRR